MQEAQSSVGCSQLTKPRIRDHGADPSVPDAWSTLVRHGLLCNLPDASVIASCRLLGARPSGRLGVSKPRNLEYSAKARQRATSKRRERRAPLPTTWGCPDIQSVGSLLDRDAIRL